VTTDEPLRRRRLVVLFRALLFVPQYVVLSVWALLLVPVVPLAWVVAVATGGIPRFCHRFLGSYLRYQGQTTAWLYLLSATYPDPMHTVEHPFHIEVPPRGRQPRLVILFRLVLALPAAVLASVFNVILTGVGVAAWFVGLVLGRTTAGLQELGTFCLRYGVETEGYVLLLTARYPQLEPPVAPALQLPIPGLE
jgi:hypothetical protein